MSARPMDGLLQLCTEILTPVKLPARFDMQVAIETAIARFNPDLTEASELLDALIGALDARYSSDRLVVVEEEAKALKAAFKEAEPCELSPEDEAYSDWRARHECD